MVKKLILVGVVAVSVFASCSDKPNAAPTGRLKFYIQDGMADYDSVFMAIDSVYAFVNFNPMEKMLLKAGPDTINVAVLRNGRRHLLAQADLPPSGFDGVDITFAGDGRIVVDGVSHPLYLPETDMAVHASANGKIVILKDRETDAIIDINLFESINYNNDLEVYSLDPSISVIDIDSGGAILGRTSPRANVYLFNHDSTDTLSFTRSDGDSLAFGFYGLQPGYYDLLCRPIGADTLTYEDLLNVNVPVIVSDEYDLGLLELPTP